MSVDFDPANNKYRKVLTKIDSELHYDDIKSLHFLARPSLKMKSRLVSNAMDGLQLFKSMEQSGLLSRDNMGYLRKLLLTIRRVDLVNLLEKDLVVPDAVPDQAIQVSSFRILLYQISEDLGNEDVQHMRYIYGNIPKKAKVEDGIDLFDHILKHISLETKVISVVRTLCLDIGRNDLVEALNTYEEKHIRPYSETKMDVGSDDESTAASEEQGFADKQNRIDDFHDESTLDSSENSNIKGAYCSEPNVPEYGKMTGAFDDSTVENFDHNSSYAKNSSLNSSSDNFSTNVNSECMSIHSSLSENIAIRTGPAQLDIADTVSKVPMSNQNAPASTSNISLRSINPSLDLEDFYTPLGYYKMDATPKGYCLIIDNKSFYTADGDGDAVAFNDRRGTERDRDKLKASFERLDFTVAVKPDLEDLEIVDVLKKFAALDHSNFDCFVCCILTHGADGIIYGVNGKPIPIRSLVHLFSAQLCPSLAGKPKLLFLSCCQGKRHAAAVNTIERDGDPVPDSEWTPNEADFVLGYATFPANVAYRSVSSGTFYISALTEVLDKYANREEIHDLLLRTNNLVAEKSFTLKEDENHHVVCKQIPAPQYTLRKKLKFFPTRSC